MKMNFPGHIRNNFCEVIYVEDTMLLYSAMEEIKAKFSLRNA